MSYPKPPDRKPRSPAAVTPQQQAMATAAPNAVDIQALIEDYAWEHFLDLQAASKKNDFKGIDREEVFLEVNTKQLIIQHDEPEYRNFHPTSAKPFTLFKTVFTNNTARPQAYSFKTERATESVCLIAREQGYTFGVEAQLALKTPMEILQANAGFKHEIRFDTISENSVAEILTWGVDSAIEVPAHYQTVAELVVEEMSYAGHFSVATHLSGRVVVALLRRKDSSLIMPVAANIVEILRESMNTKQGAHLKSMCTMDRQSIRLLTKGNCQFQFAMKQRVVLNEEALSEDKATQTT